MYRLPHLHFSFLWFKCQPGCLTIQIRTVLCVFLILLTYSVTQACVVSVFLRSQLVVFIYLFSKMTEDEIKYL